MSENPFKKVYDQFIKEKHLHDFTHFYTLLKDGYEPFFNLTQIPFKSFKSIVDDIKSAAQDMFSDSKRR